MDGGGVAARPGRAPAGLASRSGNKTSRPPSTHRAPADTGHRSDVGGVSRARRPALAAPVVLISPSSARSSAGRRRVGRTCRTVFAGGGVGYAEELAEVLLLHRRTGASAGRRSARVPDVHSAAGHRMCIVPSVGRRPLVVGHLGRRGTRRSGRCTQRRRCGPAAWPGPRRPCRPWAIPSAFAALTALVRLSPLLPVLRWLWEQLRALSTWIASHELPSWAIFQPGISSQTSNFISVTHGRIF